ncbi:hypothetical protein ACJX0J_015620, partial [Zea mays]
HTTFFLGSINYVKIILVLGMCPHVYSFHNTIETSMYFLLNPRFATLLIEHPELTPHSTVVQLMFLQFGDGSVCSIFNAISAVVYNFALAAKTNGKHKHPKEVQLVQIDAVD